MIAPVNADFEAGTGGGNIPNWFTQDANASLTATTDTGVFRNGAKAAKLVNTAAGEDDCIFQDIAAKLLPGHAYRVSAWCNCTAFTAGAVGSRGLYVYDLTTFVDAFTTLTAVTGGWVQHVINITLGATDTGVEIRLYAPQATVYWDDVELIDLSEPAIFDFPHSRFGPF